MDRRYLVVAAVIVVALVIVGVAVWYYYHSRKNGSDPITPPPAPVPPSDPSWMEPSKSTGVTLFPAAGLSLVVSGSPSRPHFESFGIDTEPFILDDARTLPVLWSVPLTVPLSTIYGSTATLQGATGGSYDIGFRISTPMLVPIGTPFPGAGTPSALMGTVHVDGGSNPAIGLTFVPPTTTPFGNNVYWSGKNTPLQGLFVSVGGIQYSTFTIGTLKQQTSSQPQGCLKQGYFTFEAHLTNGSTIRAAVSAEAAYGGSIVPSYGGSDIDHYAIRSWGTSGILTPGPSQVIHQGTTLIQIPTSLVASGVCP